jgi:hypothetical protein
MHGREVNAKFPYVCVHGRIILKQILKEYERRIWIGFLWLRIGRSGGIL